MSNVKDCFGFEFEAFSADVKVVWKTRQLAHKVPVER